ncbi:hypothetical protein ACFLZM_07190, partial [Thermodesulfobacteriota bacterium]
WVGSFFGGGWVHLLPAVAHSNISSNVHTTIIDHWTGDEIANVSSVNGTQFNLAGKSFAIKKIETGKISVISDKREKGTGKVSYQAKRLPVSLPLTQQVLKYFKLPTTACIILDGGYVAHFGGDFIGMLIKYLAKPVLFSNAWVASHECNKILSREWSSYELEEVVSKNWESFKSCVPLGAYFDYLPKKWQREGVIKALNLEWWADWLSARELKDIESNERAKLMKLLL